MKKRILILLGILILAGGGGGAWYYYRNYGQPVADGEAVYVSSVGSITGYTAGVTNRYAGVVEPQETVEVNIENGRVVKEVEVKVGQEVKQGELLFQYDLSSIQQNLKETQLELDRLKNEAMSLQSQIATLEKEKKQASKDSQLSYTIEIETNKMNLQKNQYDQQSKQAQIEKLEDATENTDVRSEIDGIVQKIDTSRLTSDDGDSLEEGNNMMDNYGSDQNSAFITILSTGAYRIKGKVNELNAWSIIEGSPVIIRSRVDETQTWRGTMGSVDRDNANSDKNINAYYYGVSSESETSSSTYPFYVSLDSSDGLMLGQHVYIELDNGQDEKKEGLWLSELYIVDADKEEPYVWAQGSRGRLEKRTVVLGEYDEDLSEYEILEGLTRKDNIAYPQENLQEGMAVTTNADAAMVADPSADLMEQDVGEPDMTDMENGMDILPEDSNEILEPVDGSFVDEYPEGTEEELVPMEEGSMNAAGATIGEFDGEVMEEMPGASGAEGVIEDMPAEMGEAG